MNGTSKLPPNVLKEISLYMSPGEKLVDAILSASGPVGKLGELWMILTDLTVFFHTKEYGKDPVVALISRKDLKMVKYDHHPNGTTLMFVPASQSHHTIKVPFPKAQRAQVNAFCEELAKTVPFELVGATEKTGPEPKPDPKAASAAPVNGKASTASPTTKPPAPLRKTEGPKPPPPAEPVKTPFVEPVMNQGKTETTGNAGVKIVRAPDTAPEEAEVTDSGQTQLKYAFLATIIALLVTFLWFQIFSRSSDEREWN